MEFYSLERPSNSIQNSFLIMRGRVLITHDLETSKQNFRFFFFMVKSGQDSLPFLKVPHRTEDQCQNSEGYVAEDFAYAFGALDFKQLY